MIKIWKYQRRPMQIDRRYLLGFKFTSYMDIFTTRFVRLARFGNSNTAITIGF
jgi:hypothetical protein